MTLPVKKINHIAIIMDGNGRWAKKKGELRIFGHTNGVGQFKIFCHFIYAIYLTLFVFSTENWKRPKLF